MGSAQTTFTRSAERPVEASVDVLIVPVYQHKPASCEDNDAKPSPAWNAFHDELDWALQGTLKSTAAEEKFDAGRGKILSFRKAPLDPVAARRVLVVGLGQPDKLTPAHLETSLKKAVESAQSLDGLTKIGVVLPDCWSPLSIGEMAQSLVDAVYQATYRSEEAKEPAKPFEVVLFWADPCLEHDLWLGQVIARARSRAKDLVNKPSNLKTTRTLAEMALSLEGKPGIDLYVLDDVDRIAKEMPCFYTVAMGSVATDPPKFIRVRYTPKGEIKRRIALVGKSVIFDTGGYQVKPGDFMNTMKGDMTGGAVVLATMEALSEIAPAGVEVTAYLAATPNKIDSHAMLPDMIVNTTCGKKVEIRHTDAEGRLTLIDAVAKAAERHPDVIVTMATLTGSAMRAVGMAMAVMANEPAVKNGWRDRVESAARAVGDPIQALDVWESDFDDIKSKLDGADIINTSTNKNRGAQSAAAFVMSGAPECLPLVHLDIAGADMTGDEKATGIGQKTLLRFVLNEACCHG
jgi:leucyl aminopeptidase